MSHEYQGRSWRLPIGADGAGRIATADYEDAIRQSIWTILGTSLGERVMRPEFGCGLSDLVFEVGDAATAGRATTLVRRALLRWEPRIDVDRVRAEFAPERPNLLLIEIDYRVRAANSRFNLVYPFYLD